MTSFGRTAVAVLIAGGLFSYLYFVESKKEPSSGEKDAAKREKVLPGFDKAKAQSLTLTRRGGETVRAERKGEGWVVESGAEFAADPNEVSSVLDALQSLESEDVVAENATDLAPYGLAEPKLTVSVTALGAAKPFELELGDAVPAGSGLFARVPGSSRLFTVSSFVENSLSKSAFDLRDRSLLRVKREAIQSMELVEKGRSVFRVARGSAGEDDWKIVAPLETRAARWNVESFLGLIENARMESIVTEKATAADLAKYGFGGAARIVRLGLDGKDTATLEIGAKTADGKSYARTGASDLVATIAPAIADDLDKGLKNLRLARLLDVAAYEVAGFDATAGGSTRTFTKSSAKDKDGGEQVTWKGTPPAKDAGADKVSDALFAIGGLDVADFVDAPRGLETYGLDAPVLKVTLRFDRDKAADWFEVAVKGEAAYARRRDDAAILKLDKAKTEALIKSFAELGS